MFHLFPEPTSHLVDPSVLHLQSEGRQNSLGRSCEASEPEENFPIVEE